MTDNPNLRRPHDAQKINLSQAHEQGWWLGKFRFNRTELPVLNRIIKALGTNQADKVTQWIQKNKKGIVKKWREECRIK